MKGRADWMEILDRDRLKSAVETGFDRGCHEIVSGVPEAMCVMEAVSWSTTGSLADMPSCIPKRLAYLFQWVNDWIRTELWHSELELAPCDKLLTDRMLAAHAIATIGLNISDYTTMSYKVFALLKTVLEKLPFDGDIVHARDWDEIAHYLKVTGETLSHTTGRWRYLANSFELAAVACAEGYAALREVTHLIMAALLLFDTLEARDRFLRECIEEIGGIYEEVI